MTPVCNASTRASWSTRRPASGDNSVIITVTHKPSKEVLVILIKVLNYSFILSQ
jgi:hypothetical protein